MSRRRMVVVACIVIVVAAAGYWAFRNPQRLGFPAPPEARPVPSGDQEIAWIHTAINATNWERFVEGIRHAERTMNEKEPTLGLVADFTNAFPDQTTSVPEVVISVRGCRQRLWIRWYKLTNDQGIGFWVQKLASRTPPPLAIIGGNSSDRARDLALELEAVRSVLQAPPLLLITTATADEVIGVGKDGKDKKDLMAIYADRSFRFCFTNRQIAEAVVSFLWRSPEFGPTSLFAGAVPFLAGGNALGGLALIATARPRVYTMEWVDDPYSMDLSNQFRIQLFNRHADFGQRFPIHYSVGDYYRPNTAETQRAAELLDELRDHPNQRPILVVPAVDRAARRVLRTLSISAPLLFHQQAAVAVSGDSISFEVIYHDSEVGWNVQEIPIPLLLFSHENPVDWPKSDGTTRGPVTNDKLHSANIVRAVVDAAFTEQGAARNALLSSPDYLGQRLRERNPGLFDDSGNRTGGSGEYVIYLRPRIELGLVKPEATIEVWSWQREAGFGSRSWKRQRSLSIRYGEGGSDP